MGGIRLLPTGLNLGAGSDDAAGRVSIEATETSGVCVPGTVDKEWLAKTSLLSGWKIMQKLYKAV